MSFKLVSFFCIYYRNYDNVNVSEHVYLVMTRVTACLLDVSFVLAFSGNVTRDNNTNWRFVTDFMVNVTHSINVGEGMTHVGAVSTGMLSRRTKNIQVK